MDVGATMTYFKTSHKDLQAEVFGPDLYTGYTEANVRLCMCTVKITKGKKIVSEVGLNYFLTMTFLSDYKEFETTTRSDLYKLRDKVKERWLLEQL